MAHFAFEKMYKCESKIKRVHFWLGPYMVHLNLKIRFGHWT